MDPSKWFKLDKSTHSDHLHRFINAAKKLGTKDKHMDISMSESKESRRNVLTTINCSLYEQLTRRTALPENTINGILLRAEELITMDNRQCYHHGFC